MEINDIEVIAQNNLEKALQVIEKKRCPAGLGIHRSHGKSGRLHGDGFIDEAPGY